MLKPKVKPQYSQVLLHGLSEYIAKWRGKQLAHQNSITCLCISVAAAVQLKPELEKFQVQGLFADIMYESDRNNIGVGLSLSFEAIRLIVERSFDFPEEVPPETADAILRFFSGEGN